MSDTTARLHLPTIQPGQAQKEMSHNEALAAIDLLLHPAVVSAGSETPPAAPVIGAAWIVGSAPTGAWSGQARQLAGWTSGGWRFVAPHDGMTAWVSDMSVFARYSLGEWWIGDLTCTRLRIDGVRVVGARKPAVADPAGGATIDAEARAAIVALLARLRDHGLIAA